MKHIYVVALKYALNKFEDYDAVDLNRIRCCSTQKQAIALARATCTEPVSVEPDVEDSHLLYIESLDGSSLGYIKREPLWGNKDGIKINSSDGGYNTVLNERCMHFNDEGVIEYEIMAEQGFDIRKLGGVGIKELIKSAGEKRC